MANILPTWCLPLCSLMASSTAALGTAHRWRELHHAPDWCSVPCLIAGKLIGHLAPCLQLAMAADV